MKLKHFILLIVFSLQINAFAQKIEFSPNNKFIATYFQKVKDSVIFTKEDGSYTEELVYFAKYNICIYDATGKELHKRETKVFQLANNAPNVKMQFDKNSELLYVAIENKEVLVFNTLKGFVTKYKALNFCFNNNGNDIAILESKRIYFPNSDKQINRKFKDYTDINYSIDNKFIIVSRKAKNRDYCFFIDVENPKHKKTIVGTKVKYNSENEQVTVLKSSKIKSYKCSNFKSNEKALSKKFLEKEYKKNITLASFNLQGTFFVHQSDKYISVLSAKGKSVFQVEKPSNFISYSWNNDSEIKLISKNKIQYYNIETELLSNEENIEFNYPANVKKYSEAQEAKYKFYSNGLAVLKIENGFLLKNTATNKQIYIENESFLHFSKNEEYIYSKSNEEKLNVYKIEDAFNKKQTLQLESEELKMLSPITNTYYSKETKNKFYSPNYKTIATIYSDGYVDSIYHSSGRSFEWVYNELFTNDSTEIDSSLTANISFLEGLILFNTEKESSTNFLVNKEHYTSLDSEIEAKFYSNPILQEKYKEKYKKKQTRNEFLRYNRIFNKAISDFKITNHGTLILKQNTANRYEVIDIEKNKNLIVFEDGKAFFSPDNSFAVVKAYGETILYNTISGKEIRTYNTTYSDIRLTNDTTFFIGLNKAGDYIFEGLQKQENLDSSIVKITSNGKKLLVIEGNRTKVKLYSLPALEEISSNSISENYKRFFNKPEIEISENGTFFSCTSGNELLILSTQAESKTHILLNNLASKNKVYWLDNEDLIITAEESNSVLNAATEIFDNNKDLNFYFSNSDLNYLEKQKKEGFVSENTKFSVLECSKGRQTDLYLKSTSQKYKNYFIANAKFVTFGENDERIYFTKGNSKLSFIETKQLLNGTDELTIHSIKAVKRRNRNLPPRPALIVKDAKAPEGYTYERFIEAKTVNEIKGELGMYAFSLISNGNNVNLNVHLLDDDGTFYSSGNKEENKDIWCELWIKYPNGRVKKIKNFDVLEEGAGNKEKQTDYALGLVLDHSGSMGKTRCLYEQKGVYAFIKEKRENDAVSILKFDHNVSTEVLLTNSKNNLLDNLVLDGGKDFGGNTALYDAIYNGIHEITKKASRKKKKAIIVITDGYENSSYAYLNELILYALENQVQIHTIGFGASVNKPVLQAIAYQTGGSFYEIYDTKNFSWIFKDVFNKLSNHYSVKFTTPKKGKYTIMLKSCSDKIKNNIIFAFDNNKIDYSKITEADDDGFGIPFLDLSKTIDVETFKSNKPILNLNKIINKNGSNLDYHTKKEFDKIEFPDIKFVYDKTTIIRNTDKGLDDVILFLETYPHIMIEISGHTDNQGEDDKNLLLSKDRAKKIKSIIVKAGINAHRITTIGYGEAKPIATNETEKGKLKNRRVEFRIVN